MKKGFLLVASLLLFASTQAQDFSNKGKDFWISFAGHINITNAVMGVYITSNVAASGTVTVGTSAVPFTVAANNVTRVFIGPNTTPNNGSVYLSTMDGVGISSGIHVTSDKAVAVYAHIIFSARSGATLVLPTNVWGKEYIVPSYRNTGTTTGYGEINVMASDTNTLIEITPAVKSRNGQRLAGVPYTVLLPKPGDVYQVQFEAEADISGTRVRSVATGAGGCKPIGVYSATTWSGFDCTSASGGDNLYQQLFPLAAWGKNFLTAPFLTRNYDIVRVFVQDITTVVSKTEAGITSTLPGTPTNGYYEYRTSQPTRISADKPISVVQYITSQSCGFPGNPPPFGDPEMVILNPLEQTINNITVFSAHQSFVPAGQSRVNRCFLNIIIKTSAAASFKINNAAPTGNFVPIPGTGYSYLQENVTSITVVNPVQTLKADSAFSAIAYGFGDVESYGYNAGTNVKDLFQHVIIRNQYATVDFPATCINTPFTFAITLPYQATSINWDFHGSFVNVTNNAPTPDSSYIVDNRTVYVYRLPATYNYAAVGAYPVTIIANNPTSDGCSGINQIDYDVEVFDKPQVKFDWAHTGCLVDSVFFSDTTGTGGRPVIKWIWDFGDSNADSVQNPTRRYNTSGNYNVKLGVITDVGCIADATKPITINPAPVAKFGASALQCSGTPVVFTDSSTIASGTIATWYWDYGNGRRDTLSTNTPRSIIYTATGSYTVTLQVQAAGGCKSIVFSRIITVNPKPVANFSMPVICLPAGTGQFISASTIADSTQSAFTYKWNFGDGDSANTANPIHQFTTAGPFTIRLTVSSNNGCTDDTAQALTTLYAQPIAAFNAPAEICLGDTARFTDQSTAANSTIVKWYWNFGDGTTDTVRNPIHRYTTAGTFVVKMVSRSAIGCPSDTISKTIVINALPVADFTIGSPACIAQAIAFTSTITANAGIINRWQWDFGDGAATDTANGNTVSHTYNTITTYNVSLKVTTDKGCKSTTVTKPVVIGTLPIVNFGLPQVCLNDPFAEFTDSSSANGGGNLQYLWNFGDVAATPGNPNTSTIKNGRHRYPAAGVYTVSLTVTGANGCPATLSKQVTINGETPTADFAIRNNGTICSSDSLILQNQSRVNFGNITKLEIYWDYLNSPTQILVDNTPVPDKLYYHQYTNSSQPSSQYTVRMVAYSGGVCVNETTKTVTVFSSPVAGIRASPLQVCLGDMIRFEDTTANTNLSISGRAWSFGDGRSGAGQTVSHTYSQAGTFNASLRTVTAAGCQSPAATKQVVVNAIPQVNAGPNLFVLEGGQVLIRATVTGGNATKYTWSPATWLNDSAILQPLAKPLTDINYTLTVTGAGNCTASDNVLVSVLKDLIIPNTFSPNGDGINDVWAIKSLESYPGSIIQIFDRYGRLVLKTNGYAKPWDGNVNGTALPTGTYYYIVDPKNGRKAITGSLTILR